MACYAPIIGYYGRSVNPNTGRRPIVFNVSQAFSGVRVQLPCGQCIGCRLERSRQWALRIVQEQRMHAESAFLTLTYSDKNLPLNGSLVVRDLQLFMKRLRKRRAKGLRFFGCGEYGETTRRPHYHVLLLNTMFPDQIFCKKSFTGDFDLKTSVELSELWPFGEHWIGDVTFQSAAYVARYCIKKVTGKNAEAHYGERQPEFTCMSRRPGIGYTWFTRHGDEAYARDSCVANGREVGLPRYYDTKYEAVDPTYLGELKVLRRRNALERGRSDNTPARRKVREKFEELKLDRFRREPVR